MSQETLNIKLLSKIINLEIWSGWLVVDIFTSYHILSYCSLLSFQQEQLGPNHETGDISVILFSRPNPYGEYGE